MRDPSYVRQFAPLWAQTLMPPQLSAMLSHTECRPSFPDIIAPLIGVKELGHPRSVHILER